MELKEYLNQLTKEEQECLARNCDTSLGFLRNVSYGIRRAGESLCINIERESNRKVTCEELRPDVDWKYIRGTRKTEAA